MTDLDKTITWVCHSCNHSNERTGDTENCSKCKEPRKMKEVNIKYGGLSARGWTCKRCMYDNWSYKPSCESCGKVNIPLQRLFSTDDNKWHCNICTYLNKQELKQCELCTANRHDFSNSAHSTGVIDEEDIKRVNRPDELKKFEGNRLHTDKTREDHALEKKEMIQDGADKPGTEDTANNGHAAEEFARKHPHAEKLIGTKCLDDSKLGKKYPADTEKGKYTNKEDWQCGQCTLINKIHLKQCAACYDPRPLSEDNNEPVTQNSDRLNVWTCEKCTLINENYRKECETCFAARPRHERIADGQGCIYGRQADTVKVNPKHVGKNLPLEQISKPPFRKNTGKQNNEEIIGKEERQSKDKEKLLQRKKHDFKSEGKMKNNGEPTTVQNSKVNTSWSCKYCTFENLSSDEKCQMCMSYRPETKANKERGQRNCRLQPAKGSIKVKDLQAQEERAAVNRWKYIVDYCRKNKEMFVDDSFHPSLEALYFNPDHTRQQKNSQWLRCHSIQTEDSSEDRKNWVVYRSQPLPDDIQQGTLGNCWFLSALAVLTERKELLDKIILTKTFCKEGAYIIRLCKDGRWKTIILDDWFLCDTYKRLKYSKARRKQLWVPLIEKAAAKIHGCYQALTTGRVVEGLSLLTGQPCEQIELQEQDDDDMEINSILIWSRLVNARENKFLMGTSCGSGKMVNVDIEKYKAVGLIAHHAYSLLDVQDLQGNQLVKIRNPWGTVSWKGDWSDGSSKWKTIDPVAKKDIQLDGNKKGIFWMCLEDFMKYFDSVEVCKVRTDWQEVRFKGIFPPHAAEPWKFVQFTLPERTELCFRLFQKNKRGIKSCQKELLVDVFIVVLENITDEESPGLFKKIAATSRRCARSFVGCDVTLEPGSYTVACLAFKQWRTGMPAVSPLSIGTLQKLNKDYMLSVHSSKFVIPQEINSHHEFYEYALADIIIQLTLGKGKTQKLEEHCMLYSLWWYGAIFVLENSSKKMYAQVKFDTSRSSQLLSTRGSFLTMDCIPPQHRQVIMVLTPVDAHAGWLLNRSTCFIMSNEPGLHQSWKAQPGVLHQPDIMPDVAGLHAPRPF